MVLPSVHLVRSTKTQFSLSRPTLHDQTENTDLDHKHPVHIWRAVWTALALQQLALVRLAIWASNYINVPPVNPTYSQNRDIDLPTTRNDRPAAFNDSTDLSYPQRSSTCTHLRLNHTSYRHHSSSWRYKYYNHELYTCTCKHDNNLSSLLYLLPHLCFLHCFWLSLLARINLNSFAGSICLSALQQI